jgi:phage terminase large subunit-like protein
LDLKQLQSSPATFRRALKIDADGRPRRLGSVADRWQAVDYLELDDGWRQVAGQEAEGPLRGWLERPRGHSKTLDLAVMATWCLFASRRQLKGYGAAADQDQAKLLRDAVDRLLRMNPWLGQILRADRFKVTNERTGSTLEILTSDAPTSYGLTPDFLICDEVVHWRQRDLWDSLISSAAKRERCMVVVISNAGFMDSWQWEVRGAVCQDESWHFSRLDGPQASWITEDRLAEQRRLLPSIAYRRLWLNEWSTGSGDALSPDDIDRALVLDGPIFRGEPGYVYFGGLDLGLSRDKAALCVVGKHVGWHEEKPRRKRKLTRAQRAMIDAGIVDEPEEDEDNEVWHEGTGRLKLASLHLWSPPAQGKICIGSVESTVRDLHKRFGGLMVGADPWQAHHLIQRLKDEGVCIEPVDPTGSNLKSMCSAVLESFSEGLIDLYHHAQLLVDLKSLRVEERSYGCRLTSPRGPSGHGDAATALAIALHVARRETGFSIRPPSSIICY